MKRALILLIFVLLSSGCIEESGHWQHATVVSNQPVDGNLLEFPSNVIIFNDTSGNFYILRDHMNPLRPVDLHTKLEVNKTYLVHVIGSGYVDRVGIEGE